MESLESIVKSSVREERADHRNEMERLQCEMWNLSSVRGAAKGTLRWRCNWGGMEAWCAC